MKFLALLLLLLLSACAGSSPPEAVPTLLQLPTDVPLEVSPETPTDAPNDAPSITPSPDAPAVTEPPSLTPRSTRPPTQTPAVTAVPVTATPETVVIVPTIAQLPTLPPVDVPMVETDIIITEIEFQTALEAGIAGNPNINEVLVDFVAGDVQGVQVRMTAPGGQALVTGDVFIVFQPLGGSVLIQVLDISVGAAAPPQRFVDIALDDLNFAVIDAFDDLIRGQLGEEHDLETITITDSTMEITLFVPQG